MKMKVWRFASLCVLLVFPLILKAEVHVHPGSEAVMVREVLTYVNQYRAARGLPKLVMNEAANREARRHSLEMAKHQVPFGHSGFSRRMGHLYREIENADGGAENVAYNYKTARIVVDGWINSPGHRRNMVGHYDTTGIGIARDAQGRLYFTQLFVRTRQHKHPQTRALREARRTHVFLG